ncbi:RDD family protein [Anaerovorax sp. IOR16]|uniref:RDD family protein n=1 Tax=Anaerovorax sp. IOR16 TaxID=2773458 RepID=UPI0019D0EE90|nr:RDD family protein [Anaerovorax sp. IOR16]
MQQEYLKENEENKNEVRVVELEEKTDKIYEGYGKYRYYPTNPWRRYFSRMIDGIIINAIILLVTVLIVRNINSKIYETVSFSNVYIMITLIIIFIFFFIEPLLLYQFGTTPGRWILGIKLISEKEQVPLTFKRLIVRNWQCFLYGFGLGFPIISLFTMLNAFDYVNQNSNGQSKWDEKQGTIVLYKNLSFINYIMIILMILIEIGDAIWNSIV